MARQRLYGFAVRVLNYIYKPPFKFATQLFHPETTFHKKNKDRPWYYHKVSPSIMGERAKSRYLHDSLRLAVALSRTTPHQQSYSTGVSDGVFFTGVNSGTGIVRICELPGMGTIFWGLTSCNLIRIKTASPGATT